MDQFDLAGRLCSWLSTLWSFKCGNLTVIFSCTLQVELMRSLEDRDDQYRTMLDEKLQLGSIARLIQAPKEDPVF